MEFHNEMMITIHNTITKIQVDETKCVKTKSCGKIQNIFQMICYAMHS